MTHCPNCGKPQETGSRFCQYCGMAIPQKKKKKAWPIVLVAAILVCALAAGLLLVPGMMTESRWQEQYDLGMRYLDDGDYEEAVLAFLTAIDIDPNRPEAYLGAAEAYVRQGDYDKAISILKKGVRATGDEDLEEELEVLKEQQEQGIPEEPPQSGTVSEALPEPDADYALKVDGYTFSVVEMNYYFLDGISEFVSVYGQYSSMLGIDLYTPLDQQFYDTAAGMTWADYFLEQAIQTAIDDYILCREAKAAGYVLTEEEEYQWQQMEEYLDLEASVYGYGYGNIDSYLQDKYCQDASLDSYKSYWYRRLLASSYGGSHYQQMAPSDAEIQSAIAADSSLYAEYADVHTVNVRHSLIMPQGGTYDNATGIYTYSDQEWSDAAAEAEMLLVEWLESGSGEEGFAMYAQTCSVDYGSAENGGLYTDVYPGQMVPAFHDWCFDSNRQPGDTGIVQTEYGYHIMYFCSRNARTYQEILVGEQLQLDAYEKWYQDMRAQTETVLGSMDGVQMDIKLAAD